MEVAKNSLTENKGTEVAKKPKEKTIVDVIKSMQTQFEIALPKHLNSDKFVRVAITTIRKNPALAKCNRESLLGALMVSAQLGLEPGILEQAYLIPYGNEVQFQISYKGMIELLRRSGQLKDIYAYPVYENDEIDIVYGLNRDLIHKPNFEDRGNVKGYYAVAILKDNTKAFYYMTKKEIEQHRDKFSKSAKSSKSPWTTDFDAMAEKTVLKKMLKYLPVSTEYLESMTKDENTYKYDEKEKQVEVKDMNIVNEDIEEAEIVKYDENTGEVLENESM